MELREGNKRKLLKDEESGTPGIGLKGPIRRPRGGRSWEASWKKGGTSQERKAKNGILHRRKRINSLRGLRNKSTEKLEKERGQEERGKTRQGQRRREVVRFASKTDSGERTKWKTRQ